MQLCRTMWAQGCNSTSYQVVFEGYQVAVEWDGVMTEMACDEAESALEFIMGGYLPGVTSFEFDGDNLVLTGRRGQPDFLAGTSAFIVDTGPEAQFRLVFRPLP